MIFRSTSTCIRVISSAALSVALLTVLVAAPGCDIIGGDDGMEGIWEATGSDEVYLNVTKSLVTSYDYQGDSFDEGDDCYDISSLPVTSRDGDTWTLRVDFFGQPLDVTMVRDGDRLTVTVLGETETFRRSSKKASDFTPACDA